MSFPTVNIFDTVEQAFQGVKDIFQSFDFNPFSTSAFVFHEGLDYLISFIVLMAILQFIVKIKKVIF